MELNLKREIKDCMLYYVIDDTYYLFSNYKDIPNIEEICYKMMKDELNNAFLNKPFKADEYKSLLFMNKRITIDENVINMGTSYIFNDLISNIRYNDLNNVINSFRKKLSVKALNYFREKVMEIKVEDLSEDTKDLFNFLLSTLNYQNDKKELFKEIMFLATIDEYNRAYKVVYLEEQEIDSYKEEILKWEDELEASGN